MKYEEAIAYLEKLPKFGKGPGLKRVKSTLKALGNPHKNLKYVHVTGTNGKGSTCAILSSILTAANYKVGLYTSPHLHKFNERFSLNRTNISNTKLVHYIKQISKILNEELCQFELLTVIAFKYFADEKVDIAIMETGIGGQLDSTNVMEKSLAIITNIGLEHIKILGKSKKKIALDKAGIIKRKSIIITSEQNPNIQEIFRKKSVKENSQFITINTNDIVSVKNNTNYQEFNFEKLENLKIPLIGKHQLSNAALAIKSAQSLENYNIRVSRAQIRKGLLSVKWHLRLELTKTTPQFLLDCGHNLHGIRAIHKALDVFKEKHKILIFGCSYNRPYEKMVKILSQEANTIILTKAAINGVEPSELKKSIPPNKKIYLTQNVKEAITRSREIANKDDLILVLGGLFLSAEAKEVIEKS